MVGWWKLNKKLRNIVVFAAIAALFFIVLTIMNLTKGQTDA
jgi:hypothetical protein